MLVYERFSRRTRMTGERVVEFWQIFHMEWQILLAMEIPTVISCRMFLVKIKSWKRKKLH
ncbi:hypothetical protein IC582_019736 [Cucumis melo]